MVYATLADLQTIWRPLNIEEQVAAEQLLADASAKVRNRAKGRRKDFDAMVEADADLASVAKSIVCKTVMNAMKMTEAIPASQFSESAGGYTVSGTFYAPGGGLQISKADWKELGLAGQMFGGLDVYGISEE